MKIHENPTFSRLRGLSRGCRYSLQNALARSRRRRLLAGWQVYVAPGASRMPLEQLRQLVTAAGGTWLEAPQEDTKVLNFGEVYDLEVGAVEHLKGLEEALLEAACTQQLRLKAFELERKGLRPCYLQQIAAVCAGKALRFLHGTRRGRSFSKCLSR